MLLPALSTFERLHFTVCVDVGYNADVCYRDVGDRYYGNVLAGDSSGKIHCDFTIFHFN